MTEGGVVETVGEGVADVGWEEFFEVRGDMDHFLEEEIEVTPMSIDSTVLSGLTGKYRIEGVDRAMID